eukprot:353894_1
MALLFDLTTPPEHEQVTTGGLESLVITFEWLHIITNTVTLLILLTSIFIIQRSDLMITKIKKSHIAETSQHLVSNMIIMIIVLIYNISVFIAIFFIRNSDLQNSHSTISKINITIGPFITCCIGVHLLGTIKWNKLHKYIQIFLVFSFFMSLSYHVSFIIIHYPLFVALNDALKEIGGSMVRAIIIDGFAVFITIMYYRAIEQVAHFKHDHIHHQDLKNELLKNQHKKKYSVSTNSEQTGKIQTCHMILLVLMITFFIIIDFFTIDETQNICKIGKTQFHCLYYMIMYFLLFYIIHIACIYYVLFKLFGFFLCHNIINEYQKKNVDFRWGDHILFIIALIGCLTDDMSEFVQRIDNKWDNQERLSNGLVLAEIFVRR